MVLWDSHLDFKWLAATILVYLSLMDDFGLIDIWGDVGAAAAAAAAA